MENELTGRLAEVRRVLDELLVSLDKAGKDSELARVEARMAEPSFWSDPEGARRTVQELKRLKAVVDPMRGFERRAGDIAELLPLAAEEGDGAALEELGRDLAALEADLAAFQLKAMLGGPYDANDAFLTIQAGAGGTEACDWVAMLLRMYTRWMERKGFEATIVDSMEGDAAGLRSVTLDVKGPYAYGYLRSEVGVHRLVRISPFDAAARRHTSFASVDVAPQIDEAELDVEIDEKDLRVDRFRSGGPGGQNVNKVETAVRITHLPTGLVVAAQSERSQHQNRAVAMRLLKARLYARRQEERQAELAALSGTKMEIAFGSQRRNYVLQPYKLAKDLVTGVETSDVDGVLDGDLDRFIEACLRQKIGEPAAAAASS
ncbi:MAG: peptide chain release factor 2 [Planctomycetes bacterium]|nr:peptide chain release factor 2 [Planctomycetota bacterium]